MTEPEKFDVPYYVSVDPLTGEELVHLHPDACKQCGGQGITDDRGWALVGQPYFSTKTCARCNGTMREPPLTQLQKSIPVVHPSQRGWRIKELVDNVYESWWDSPVRKRAPHLLRTDLKEARVARAVRLYLHLFYGKPSR